MLRKGIWFAAWICVLTESAVAQNFSKLYGFGDSNIDTGWYRNSPSGSNAMDAAIAAGLPQGAGGKFTEGTSAMSPEVLGAYFGLSAKPANDGGTNFATGGARAAQSNGAGEGLFRGAVSMTNQISNYLASTGGHADGNALYVVSIGGNDVSFARDQTRSTANFDLFPPGSQAAQDYLRAQAQKGVAALLGLRNAGAKYIMVPNLPQDFGNDQTVRDYRKLYATELWSGLQANGVNFIPVDINAVRKAIAANPGAFGFTSDSIKTTNPACTPGAAPLDETFSLFCSPGRLVSPDAGQTHLFADDSHLTSAGHKIIGDLEYSLLAAPGQISMLAETAVKTRAGSGLVGAIQNQIQISQGQRSRSGWNAWVTGDVSRLDIDNYNGFPDGVGSPKGMIVAGADYRVMPGVIVGGALSVGRLSLDFNRPDGRDGGGFNQDEVSASAYLAYSKGAYRFDLIGTYGHLDYDIDRVVPLGITAFSALGKTSGSNVSLAATAGYDFKWGILTHGPYVGLTLQRVHVDGFTETSTGPVALAFAEQTRDSAVGALGYRLNWDLGTFKPFANVAWKHEFASEDRSVTASLTTTTAPSFSMPAVTVGRDWAAVTAGTLIDLGNGVTAHGSVTSTLGQDNVVKHGAQVGLSIGY